MEGEGVQAILILSHVLLQPQAEKRSLFSGCHRGLQMLLLTGCRAQARSASLLGGGGGEWEGERGEWGCVLADAKVAQMTQSLCPFTAGLGAQEFLSWVEGFKLENDSFFLFFDQ